MRHPALQTDRRMQNGVTRASDHHTRYDDDRGTDVGDYA